MLLTKHQVVKAMELTSHGVSDALQQKGYKFEIIRSEYQGMTPNGSFEYFIIERKTIRSLVVWM
jgi:hypothetical protein